MRMAGTASQPSSMPMRPLSTRCSAHRAHRHMDERGHEESRGQDGYPGDGLIIEFFQADGGPHDRQARSSGQHRRRKHPFGNMHVFQILLGRDSRPPLSPRGWREGLPPCVQADHSERQATKKAT